LKGSHDRLSIVEYALFLLNRFFARFAAVARLHRAKAAQQAPTLCGFQGGIFLHFSLLTIHYSPLTIHD